MLATTALAFSTVLAAGSIVDVSARAEGRTSLLSEPVADGFGSSLTVVGITPMVRAAYEGQGLVLDGNYAPNLSLIYPSSDYFLAMHRFGGRLDWTTTPRLRLSADVTGAIGDLDAGAAVRDLGNSRAAELVGGGNFTQFPFADVITGGGLTYRATPRTTLRLDARNEITGSPSAGEDEQLILPFQTRPQLDLGLTWLLTPTDSLSADAVFQGAFIADDRGVVGNGGYYAGVSPQLSYNHTIMNGVVATTRAGVLAAVVDEAKGRGRLLHGLPLLDGRLQSSVNLSGEAAIEGTLLGGVGPFSDPLGGLLEERISVGVQGAWRVNRDLTFTTAATAFGTLYAIGGNAQIAQEAQTSVGGSFGASYNLTEWVSVNAEGLGTSRVITDKFGALTELRPEMTVLVGISGAFNLFHEGVRPAGTDPRPGRSIGTRVVALPGSSRAFTGKDENDADKKKKRERSSFRQDLERGKPDDELDEDDALDRRRRGIKVDEERLKKRSDRDDDEEEDEDSDDKDKDKKGKDGKKADPKKSGRDAKRSSTSTTPSSTIP